MKRTLAHYILFSVLLVACGPAVPAAATTSRHVPMIPACASVTVAFRTATGHEADLPVKVCGGIGKTGAYQCDIARGGIEANARLVCARLP